jgi:hypothetical protein
VLLVVTESCLAEQYPVRPGIVRASVMTLEKFERLEPFGGIPHTRVTWTQQPDMGGFIPSRAVRGAAVGQMMYVRAINPTPAPLDLTPSLDRYVSRMRKLFDKSPAIDMASSLRMETMIQNHEGMYSAREEEILEEGKKMLGVFEQQKSKKLKMASPTTQAKMAFKDGQNHAYGWSSTVVRASPAQVLALVWDTSSRFNSSYEGTLEQTLDEDGEHNKLVYVRGVRRERREAQLSITPTEFPLTRLFAQVHQEESAQPVR